jgi:hypothetical protein
VQRSKEEAGPQMLRDRSIRAAGPIPEGGQGQERDCVRARSLNNQQRDSKEEGTNCVQRGNAPERSATPLLHLLHPLPGWHQIPMIRGVLDSTV